MSFSVFEALALSSAASLASSQVPFSPQPPIPTFITMSSLNSSSSLSLSSSCVANIRPVSDNGLSVLSGNTAASEISDQSMSVWDFEHVRKNGTVKADQTWTCLWCHLTFKHWNATKVLYHLSKKSGHDIQSCRAAHGKKYREIYTAMLKEKSGMTNSVKERAADLDALVGEGQQSLAIMFEAGRQRVTNGGGTAAATVAMTNNRQRVLGSDLTIEACSSSHLTMAIADFIHSTGLPFSATQGVYFHNILKFARGVPLSYKGPSRNAIATTLLKLNYNRRIER
jgi:hypothetical protein